MNTFDGTPIATIMNTETGIPFTMRLVRKGDGYGRKLGVVHDKSTPLVEFYDARHGCDRAVEKGGEYGQFVARYYLTTLLQRSTREGLSLDGGIPAWTIDAPAMALVMQILINWDDSLTAQR
jgi:hypothetical protein